MHRRSRLSICPTASVQLSPFSLGPGPPASGSIRTGGSAGPASRARTRLAVADVLDRLATIRPDDILAEQRLWDPRPSAASKVRARVGLEAEGPEAFIFGHVARPRHPHRVPNVSYSASTRSIRYLGGLRPRQLRGLWPPLELLAVHSLRGRTRFHRSPRS